MNDESIAIAGWLLADLVLVLALLFLALTPGRDAAATTIAAPVILDIGCALSASAGETSVICTPEIGGGAASSFQWVVARGAPAGPSDAATFEASFEGAGAVGLTVSNDGGVHRATFPVLPSPTAMPIAAPVILDIGCVADTSDGQTNVTCTPQLGGDAPSSHEWAAERGQPAGSINEPSFDAWFESAGAVRLTVANESGAHSAAFPVLPPIPTAVVELASAEVLTDFRFDQIVLRDVQLGQADWTDIAGGRVRAGLIKSQEDESLGREWFSTPSTQPEPADFLRAKLEQGLRIALVETFSHEPGGAHRSLSRQVNDAFYEGLLRALYAGGDGVGVHDVFVDCDARTKWFVDYRDTTFDEDEVRINIFFVRPSDTEKTCQ